MFFYRFDAYYDEYLLYTSIEIAKQLRYRNDYDDRLRYIGERVTLKSLVADYRIF